MIGWLVGVFRLMGAKDSMIAVLVLALLFTSAGWHRATTAAKSLDVVYRNPAVKYVDRIVYKTGPVRIKTVIIKEKSGDETTTIEEERGPEETVTDHAGESAPVPVHLVMTPARTDRYLLSVGLNRLSADLDGKALFVGYGWKNRFDLQVGGVERDGFSPWLLATLRF